MLYSPTFACFFFFFTRFAFTILAAPVEPVPRSFALIQRDNDGTIRLAYGAPGDGLYSIHNETHAQYHGNDQDLDMNHFDFDFEIPPTDDNSLPLSKRESCSVVCHDKEGKADDIKKAHGALAAQFGSGKTWGGGNSGGHGAGSIFQVVNNVYAYACDLGGKGQTTSKEQYRPNVICLMERCATHSGVNTHKSSKVAFGRNIGGFNCDEESEKEKEKEEKKEKKKEEKERKKEEKERKKKEKEINKKQEKERKKQEKESEPWKLMFGL